MMPFNLPNQLHSMLIPTVFLHLQGFQVCYKHIGFQFQYQGCTNPGYQVTCGNNICGVEIFEGLQWYLLHVTLLVPKILRWLLVLREFVHPCNHYDENDDNCSLSTLVCYFMAVTVPTFEVPSYLDEIMDNGTGHCGTS